MIPNKTFIELFKQADEETRESMFSFALYVICTMPLVSRVEIAFRILFGKSTFFIITHKEKKK